jgi:hypothetical protein
MTYAVLQISAAAYKDIRDRLTALDERLNPTPSYADEYIMGAGPTEKLLFGTIAFEALPPQDYSVDPAGGVNVSLTIWDRMKLAARRWEATMLASSPERRAGLEESADYLAAKLIDRTP